jgi:RNA polymerase sigma factor (sigma-70 family)
VERIQRFVAARVYDPHMVADLVAGVFVAAVETADQFEAARGSPTGWLYGIARNVVADHARNQQRELKAVRRIAGRRLLDPDSITRIEEIIDAGQVLRALDSDLAALSAADRALFELVALDGLSVRDAAQVLGVKPGTARVRLHRSRRLLQAIGTQTTQNSAPRPSPIRGETS